MHQATVTGSIELAAEGRGRRRGVLLGDGNYSCVHLGGEVLAAQATLITRLRRDARQFAFPAPAPPGRRGPKLKKGAALAKLSTREDEARAYGARPPALHPQFPRYPTHHDLVKISLYYSTLGLMDNRVAIKAAKTFTMAFTTLQCRACSIC